MRTGASFGDRQGVAGPAAGRPGPEDLFNKDGLVDELKKALSERILNTEIDEHLDDDSGNGKSNHKTIIIATANDHCCPIPFAFPCPECLCGFAAGGVLTASWFLQGLVPSKDRLSPANAHQSESARGARA